MPGITTIENPPADDVVDEALDSVCFTPAYGRQDAVDDSEHLIATTGYDAYPFEVFEFDEATIVLEGYLYDADDVEATVSEILPLLREGKTDELGDWVRNRDGDFLIVVTDHTDGTTWAVNDAFGRLPTYRASFGDVTILSRELKVIRQLANELEDGLEPNRLAFGQTLLFGYPLGTRTLYEGVEQLPPGSVLEVGTDEAESLHEWRLDRHTNANRSIEENAKQLKKRFVESCRRRSEVTDHTIVSMSGGLDSRAVLAAYTYTDGPVTAATSARKDGGNADEVDIAREVARTLDVPWESYIADRTEEHREKLLDMTQGMNNLGMAIGLDFAEQVAAKHGDPMFITGDGIAIPDRWPRQEVDSIDDIVKSVTTQKQVFSLEDVTALTGVTEAKLVESLRERLHSYPETTVDGKHLHFFFRERVINFQNHGEDRTRYQMWSTTPAYSPEFFAESMACPPEQKRGSKLSRAFLTELDPRSVEIDYVDYGTPINSFEYRAKRYAYEWLLGHPELKKRVTSLIGGKSADSTVDMPRELVYTPNDANSVEPYLSSEEIQRITWNNSSYSTHQKNVLLTAVSAITKADEKKTVLEA
ncbi:MULTISPECIES: asparagine synthase-related protein [Natrialbaceae]|uniref:asparagine synthase-related protein n=1 Tax=Natrialbaceae TaxID=1644061 RepID=UPI00207C6B85|nr:asparagine synthase-related protein [Natronococcus sp. CG52]